VAEITCHERYPWQITALCAGLTFSSYAVGTLIFYFFWGPLAWAYLALCAFTLVVSLRLRCTFCYYYGKRCAYGLGKLSSLIFKKGDPSEFSRRSNLVPAAVLSFSVLLLPLVGAIVATAIDFSWLVPLLFFVYILVAVVPGFLLRNTVFCRSCRQRELGCPACQAIEGQIIPGEVRR
jgi:hypothetical protein